MKKGIRIAIILMLICTLTGTAAATSLNLGDLFNSVYGGESSTSLPRNVSMPDEFSITYEYSDSGKYREVTMEKDRSGNYHYKDSEDEYLFVRERNGYRIAIGTVNGFAFKNNDKYTMDHIKTLTAKFWDCATPDTDSLSILGKVVEDGNGTVCGRKTNRYKIDVGMSYNIGGFGMSMNEGMVYDFDQETNVCLASKGSEAVSAFGLNMSDDSGDSFECIHFELSNIKLPTVD